MVEALAAISLVGTIIQFVEVGDRMISTAKEIYLSSSGTTTQHGSLLESAQYVQQLSVRLKSSPGEKLDPEQQELLRLANECCDISAQIHELVQGILPVRRASKIRNLISTISTAFQVSAIEKPLRQLEKKLGDCRNLLDTQYIKVLRFVDPSVITNIAEGMQ